MKTIEISVNDKDYSKLKTFLTNLGFVKNIHEKKPSTIDITTQLSEQSLSEEWDSKEDSRYERYYQK